MSCKLCVVALAVVVLVGCSREERADETGSAVVKDSKLVVYVVNYPLQYFAERIGGDSVRVEFPAAADGAPAFWSPDAKTVTAYQSADLILLNGAGYAKWVERVTLPLSKLVNTSIDLQDRYVRIEDTVTHRHGPVGEHSHGEAAFTIWLDPTMALEQARTIQRALSSARPAKEAAFQAGFESLERDLLELDETLRELVAGRTDKPLLASHPVYQYFARRYRLDLESVHFEPDEYPDEKSWRELENILAERPAEWMLWEGEPMLRSVEKLRSLGVQSVVFDPCGNTPEQGDFLSVMRQNVSSLEAVFKP